MKHILLNVVLFCTITTTYAQLDYSSVENEKIIYCPTDSNTDKIIQISLSDFTEENGATNFSAKTSYSYGYRVEVTSNDVIASSIPSIQIGPDQGEQEILFNNIESLSGTQIGLRVTMYSPTRYGNTLTSCLNISEIVIENASSSQTSCFRVLPVEFSYLKLSNEKGNISLKWETLTENNNSHFEVQRSYNGVSFISIGKVNGNGTSSLKHQYNYTDESVNQSGMVFYRIKQFDLDGSSNYSNVVSTEILSIDKKTTLLKHFNTVTVSTPLENYAIEVYNITGDLLKVLKNENSFELPFGVHIVIIKDLSTNTTKTFKIN